MSASLTMLKPVTVWITTNCERWNLIFYCIYSNIQIIKRVVQQLYLCVLFVKILTEEIALPMENRPEEFKWSMRFAKRLFWIRIPPLIPPTWNYTVIDMRRITSKQLTAAPAWGGTFIPCKRRKVRCINFLTTGRCRVSVIKKSETMKMIRTSATKRKG